MGLVLGFLFLNIPPALNELMVLYAVSYGKISILISALLWSHALIQVPAGIITDRLGLRRALHLCLVFIIIGGIVPAITPQMYMAVFGRVLSGTGSGLGFIVTMKMIALYAPGGRIGAFQAFFAGSFSIGSIIAYLIIPLIINWGWEWTYLSTGVAGVPLILLLWAIHFEKGKGTYLPQLSFRRVLRIRLGWIIGFYHALSYGSMINLGNWVPTLLNEVWHGTTATQYAWGGALVMLISGLGRLSGGFILFRFRSLTIANGSVLILSVLFSGLFLVSVPAIVLCLALLTAWFASINFGALFHIASKRTAPESLGSFIGFINLLANLGAVLFTLMFGWIKDTFGFLSGGFGILAIISIAALLFCRPALNQDAVQE